MSGWSDALGAIGAGSLGGSVFRVLRCHEVGQNRMLLDVLAVTAVTHPSVPATATVYSHRQRRPAALCHPPVSTRPTMSLNARLRLAVLFHYLSPPAVGFRDISLPRIA